MMKSIKYWVCILHFWMACRCHPCACLKDLCIREESDFWRAFMCTLFHCRELWFLLGGSDASVVLWQMGHLAPFFVASWLAPVLSGFTSHTQSPGHGFVFHAIRAAALALARSQLRYGVPGLEVLRLPRARLVCKDSHGERVSGHTLQIKHCWLCGCFRNFQCCQFRFAAPDVLQWGKS